MCTYRTPYKQALISFYSGVAANTKARNRALNIFFVCVCDLWYFSSVTSLKKGGKKEGTSF